SQQYETMKVMERRLQNAIMNPAMIASFGFGIPVLMAMSPSVWQEGWIYIKLVSVAGLVFFHGMMWVWRHDFALDRNEKSEVFFRTVNEIPTVLMILIIIFAIVGIILLFWGSEKRKIKSFLLEQVVAFRGWESAFRPDQFDLIYDLKKEKTPIAQLLKAKVGYKPRIGENLTGCLTHNRYQVTLPHCQITEITCSAQYCEDDDEDGRSMTTQFFNGLLITGNMEQASEGSFALYPQADVQFPGQETVEDLSNYLDAAEQILPDPYPESFILFSPNDTALASKILAIIDELSKATYPIRQSYIWVSGDKYILALDFDQYFLEGDLLNSDEDILKLKNLLAALEITSNKLFKLT
ncbi:MAG: CopD family protein, partial [Emcibacter sp.]|nr:CopD family protein [Emcibacter sp.]